MAEKAGVWERKKGSSPGNLHLSMRNDSKEFTWVSVYALKQNITATSKGRNTAGPPTTWVHSPMFHHNVDEMP